MKIDDAISVCKALGVDPDLTTDIEIKISRMKTEITLKQVIHAGMDSTEFVSKFIEIFPKYELVPVD